MYLVKSRWSTARQVSTVQAAESLIAYNRARAGFDSLRRIYDQDPTIMKQMEIYVDGGARRGTDILMALALGAKGVGFGRPFLFAQAAYGEKGAIRAVRSESQSAFWMEFYLYDCSIGE